MSTATISNLHLRLCRKRLPQPADPIERAHLDFLEAVCGGDILREALPARTAPRPSSGFRPSDRVSLRPKSNLPQARA